MKLSALLVGAFMLVGSQSTFALPGDFEGAGVEPVSAATIASSQSWNSIGKTDANTTCMEIIAGSDDADSNADGFKLEKVCLRNDSGSSVDDHQYSAME